MSSSGTVTKASSKQGSLAKYAAEKAYADGQLSLALEEFRNKLNASDRAKFQAKTTIPDASSAINLVSELDDERNRAQRQGRCVAARLSTFLDAVQQFSLVVGTFVSSNPATAALVWGSVQFTVVVRPSTFLYLRSRRSR